METIAENWASFEATVIPVDAGPVQRKEMRMTFYAGFWGALQVMQIISTESVDDDDSEAAMIQTLHDECVQFAAHCQR